jgi:hypothetical protein
MYSLLVSRTSSHSNTVSALVSMVSILGYQKLTLLSDAIALHRSSVKHLSAIDIEYRIDYTCLMLMASAEVLDGIRAVLLRGSNH